MNFSFKSNHYPIEVYNINVEKGKYSYPKWQREDCWLPEYKTDLIISILMGIDLPKIYLGDVINNPDTFIIDGGHRSRAINEFINNKYPIELDGVSVYYNKVFDKQTRNKRIFTCEEKKIFDEYNLTIVTYTEITEKDCRYIFNKLQNAKPMSIYDIINSWQSELVDYIRELTDIVIKDETMIDIFNKLKIIKKPTKTSIMCQLLSWFSIQFPILEKNIGKEKEIISLMYLKIGNTLETPIYKYVCMYTDEISDHIKEDFQETIKYILDYYHHHDISNADMNTLIHSKLNFISFNITEYEKLLKAIKIYENHKRKADNYQQNKEYEKQKDELLLSQTINAKYNGNIEIWSKSKKVGGNNSSAMIKRMDIVKEYCL